MVRVRGVEAERQWRQRMNRFRASKLSVKEFCRREGVSEPTFYHWRKRLLQSPTRGVPQRRKSAVAGFVELAVHGSAATQIELPNGIRLHVAATHAEALVAAITAAHRAMEDVQPC
jgi:transposase-like protein